MNNHSELYTGDLYIHCISMVVPFRSFLQKIKIVLDRNSTIRIVEMLTIINNHSLIFRKNETQWKKEGKTCARSFDFFDVRSKSLYY